MSSAKMVAWLVVKPNCHHVTSAELLVHLLLLWFNPVLLIIHLLGLIGLSSSYGGNIFTRTRPKDNRLFRNPIREVSLHNNSHFVFIYLHLFSSLICIRPKVDPSVIM